MIVPYQCIHSRQTGRQELPQFRVLYLGIQLAVCWRAHREAGLPWTHFWARWTDCQAPAMAPNLFPVGVPPLRPNRRALHGGLLH
jgi:hypothetical protein